MISRNINDEKAYLSATVFRAVADLWNLSGKISIIPVSGQSMLPLIKPGDRLVVSHHIGRLHLGDVITFYDKHILVVHRIMRLKKQPGHMCVTTKGDNASIYDNPISSEDILGRVVAIQRKGITLSLDRLSMRIKGWLIATQSNVMMKFHVVIRATTRAMLRKIKRRINALLST